MQLPTQSNDHDDGWQREDEDSRLAKTPHGEPTDICGYGSGGYCNFTYKSEYRSILSPMMLSNRGVCTEPGPGLAQPPSTSRPQLPGLQ